VWRVLRGAPPGRDVAADPFGGAWRVRCGEALAHLPARELGSAEREALRQGRGIARRGEDATLRGMAGGLLVCIAEPRGDELRPLVVVDEQ
jgi:hypothetical protein